MKQYVKKPIPVTAVQFFDTDESIVELQNLGLDPVRIDFKEKKLIIQTPEGEVRANEGDYIIKGIKGEFYPCRKDIFEESYIEYVCGTAG